jgi:hypothetical protein
MLGFLALLHKTGLGRGARAGSHTERNDVSSKLMLEYRFRRVALLRNAQNDKRLVLRRL